MGTPLERAIETVGTAAALARQVGVTTQAVNKWKRGIPAERAIAIERATGGVVKRGDLRPDLYPIDEGVVTAGS